MSKSYPTWLGLANHNPNLPKEKLKVYWVSQQLSQRAWPIKLECNFLGSFGYSWPRCTAWTYRGWMIAKSIFHTQCQTHCGRENNVSWYLYYLFLIWQFTIQNCVDNKVIMIQKVMKWMKLLWVIRNKSIRINGENIGWPFCKKT